jgi:lysozyme
MPIQPPIQVGQNGKNLFKEWEGLMTGVYLDSGGLPTIGIGHLLTASERSSGKIVLNGQPLTYRDGLTEQECWGLLEQDLEGAEKAVNAAVNVRLTQNQFDALVSFVFNVGNGAFLGSTLLKVLNQAEYGQVPDQLSRWVHDHGMVVKGLINRRAKEAALWSTP